MHIIKDLLDLFFPPLCYVCRRRLLVEEEILCGDCYSRIRVIAPPYCERCGKPVKDPSIKVCNNCIKEGHPCSYIRGVSPYDGIAEELIKILKYNKKEAISGVMGQLIVERIKEEENYKGVQVVVPVPLHPTRKRERGFNQAELLAKEIGKRLNIPLISDVLIRIRATPSQTKLSSKKRLENVKDAFSVNEKKLFDIKDKTVLLIDDVFTTGATLNECARTLIKKGGVSEVFGSVFAIG